MRPASAHNDCGPDLQLRVAAALNNLQQAVMQCRDAVFFTNGAGVFNRINPAFERLTGYAPLEMNGRDLCGIFVGGAQSADYRELWRALFENHSFAGRVVFLSKHGGSVPAQLTVTAVRDRQGKVQSLVGTASVADASQLASPEVCGARRPTASHTQLLIHDLNNQLMIIATRAEIVANSPNLHPEWLRELREIRAACSRATDRIRDFSNHCNEESKSKAQSASG